MSDSHFEGIIIGGGPIGWTAALALAQAGYNNIALIAPEAAPEDHRTIALMQRALGFMKGLGLAPEAIEDAAALQAIRLIDGTKRLFRAPEITFKAQEIGYPYFALNIPVQALVRHIAQRVKQSHSCAHIPHKALSVEKEAQKNFVLLENGARLSADFIIGADGRASLVRKAAGIKLDRWSYRQSAFITSFSHKRPHQNISSEFHTETGPFTLVPLQDNRSSLVWMTSPQDAERLMGLAESTLLEAVEERACSILGRLSKLGPRQAFPMSGQLAHKMASGRFFLVGESGHVFPPIGAQGLNLGMRDIETLAQLLQKGADLPDIPTLAKRYARERRGDVTAHTVGVDLLNKSLLSGFLPFQGLRSFGLYTAKQSPFLRKALMRQGLGKPSLSVEDTRAALSG